MQKYKKTIRESYGQLHASKFDNLEETDNFLETYSPPKLNIDERDQLNRPITRNEIDYVIKYTPYKQKSRTRWLHRQILPNIQRTILPNIQRPILLKLFQKVEEEGTLPKTFYETTITLIPKPKILPKKQI